jgi:hypothetical protein
LQAKAEAMAELSKKGDTRPARRQKWPSAHGRPAGFARLTVMIGAVVDLLDTRL